MNQNSDSMVFFDGRAQLISMPQHRDHRGLLMPFIFDDFPFTPCRSFIVTDVPAKSIRGQHAHRSGMQLLVCLQGEIEILMRYHGEEIGIILKPLSPSLILSAGVWCQQTYTEENSILLVFASDPFSLDSYIT